MKTNPKISRELLQQNYELHQIFYRLYHQINGINYPFDFNRLISHLNKAIDGEFAVNEIEGYKPFKTGILIKGEERNRQEYFKARFDIPGVEKNYRFSRPSRKCDNNFYKEIVEKCNNILVADQLLRIDNLKTTEKDPTCVETSIEKIFKDFKIKESTPDEIVERILFLLPDEKSYDLKIIDCQKLVLVGCCNNFAVGIWGENYSSNNHVITYPINEWGEIKDYWFDALSILSLDEN